MMEEWLIVDGYNVLGAAETAPFSSLEEARDRLIRRLSEYQAISGRKVILVFDAHRMPGAGTKQVLEQIEVQYTRQRETADERIEKLVRQLRQPGRQIFVATSDYLEQRLVFGQGAYRISSRELLREMEDVREELKRENQIRQMPRKSGLDGLPDEARKRLELWRRKK
jgi:predicted RNA-binding protein with PIN domain